MKSVKFFVSLLMQLFVLTEVKYKEMLYFSLYPSVKTVFSFTCIVFQLQQCLHRFMSELDKKKNVETMHFPRRGGFISFLETLVV